MAPPLQHEPSVAAPAGRTLIIEANSDRDLPLLNDSAR